MTDTEIELGGNIKLVGFKEVDSGSMVVLKKIIGNYARKLADHDDKFQGLEITLKKIHDTGNGAHPKYEIHARAACSSGMKTGECVERNLFVGVDDVLKKVMHTLHIK